MKKLLGTILFLLIAVPAFASIAVSPTKIDINATKVKSNYVTTAIDVRGDSKTPIRFRLVAEYFKVNNKGELVLIEKSDEPQNIAKKLRFLPAEFTVMQGKSQKVRVNIPNLNTLVDGESRAILYIEDVNPKELNLDTGREGVGAQLIVKTRVGVPIYVDRGKAVKTAAIDYAKIVKEKDGYYVETKISDSGNSKVRCHGVIQVAKEKKLISETKLPAFVVASENYNIIKTKIDTKKVEKGTYTVRLVVSYKDINEKQQNLKQEMELNI